MKSVIKEKWSDWKKHFGIWNCLITFFQKSLKLFTRHVLKLRIPLLVSPYRMNFMTLFLYSLMLNNNPLYLNDLYFCFIFGNFYLFLNLLKCDHKDLIFLTTSYKKFDLILLWFSFSFDLSCFYGTFTIHTFIYNFLIK